MSRQSFTLTEAQKAEVETLAAVLTAEQVADYFGIARRTFYDMMKRDDEIAARYKKGKAKAIGVIAQGLINKARGGDTTSMIFFLKTQAGWRETSQIEHLIPEAADEPGESGLEKLRARLQVIAACMVSPDARDAANVGGQSALLLEAEVGPCSRQD